MFLAVNFAWRVLVWKDDCHDVADTKHYSHTHVQPIAIVEYILERLTDDAAADAADAADSIRPHFGSMSSSSSSMWYDFHQIDEDDNRMTIDGVVVRLLDDDDDDDDWLALDLRIVHDVLDHPSFVYILEHVLIRYYETNG